MIVYTYSTLTHPSRNFRVWVVWVVMFTFAGFIICFFIYQFFIMFAIMNRLHIIACSIIIVLSIATLSASLFGPIFSPKALAHNLHITLFICLYPLFYLRLFSVFIFVLGPLVYPFAPTFYYRFYPWFTELILLLYYPKN